MALQRWIEIWTGQWLCKSLLYDLLEPQKIIFGFSRKGVAAQTFLLCRNIEDGIESVTLLL